MDFATFHDAVLRHTSVYQDAVSATAVRKPGKRGRPKKRRPSDTLLQRPEAKQLTAAAAQVIAERGPEWCLAHPREFRSAVIKHLGLIAQVALTVLSLVTGTGGVWVVLARLIIPAVLSWLSTTRRPVPGESAPRAIDWSALSKSAKPILRGDDA